MKCLLVTKEEYKEYDEALVHAGKKCGNPCKGLMFKGVKLKVCFQEAKNLPIMSRLSERLKK